MRMNEREAKKKSYKIYILYYHFIFYGRIINNIIIETRLSQGIWQGN